MMQQRRQELQQARADIQRLNQLVAGAPSLPQPPTVDLTEPEEIVIDDADNQALMQTMQEVLQRCSQVISSPLQGGPLIETIPSDDENVDMAEPVSKRPRSVEPSNGLPGGATS